MATNCNARRLQGQLVPLSVKLATLGQNPTTFLLPCFAHKMPVRTEGLVQLHKLHLQGFFFLPAPPDALTYSTSVCPLRLGVVEEGVEDIDFFLALTG